MNHLVRFGLFESKSGIKNYLEDIFQDIVDSNPAEGWFFWVNEPNIADDDYPLAVDIKNYWEVYISFGNEEPYHEEELGDNQIKQSIIDAIKMSISFMDSEGYNCKIIMQTEYSSDPSEDFTEELSIEELKAGDWMKENEAIKLIFIQRK